MRLRTATNATEALRVKGVPFQPTTTEVDGAPLAAEVNHGRWIVQCPACASAQLTSPDDPRFFCVHCGNVTNGGKWRPVMWPTDPDGIEDVLVRRPRLENMNWNATEAISDLEREGVEHGVD